MEAPELIVADSQVIEVGADTFVAEEVVVDASGGESAHLNDAKIHDEDEYGVLLGDNLAGDDEIQLHHRSGTDEMSVAIDLAKLSQGHYTRDFRSSNIFDGYGDGIGSTFIPNSGDAGDVGAGRECEDPNGSYVFITEDGREATSLEDIDGRTVEVANKFSKPKMSYAQLICEAILHSKGKQLTLSEIYTEIHRRHPYYLLENKNWQNSIRHNLTLNKAFVKVPRSSSEGRGSYWTMEPGAESLIFRRSIGNRGGGSPAVANVAPRTYVVQPLQPTVAGSQGKIVYVTVPAPT